VIDLADKEKDILHGLKDFQLATVNRINHLFEKGFHRVLVADEVGLGKTLVAKGLIAIMASQYQQCLNPRLFKVVYVCSNQSIAGQNLKKLKVHEHVRVDGLSDTRLSMQHLKIFEQKNDSAIQENSVQLIPLTPGTSFSMTGGGGSVQERALIFSILKRISFFEDNLQPLEELMTAYAFSSWKAKAEQYERKVVECDQNSNGEYLSQMCKLVSQKFDNDDVLMQHSQDVFDSIRQLGFFKTSNANSLILKLRKLMAEISLDMLDADLVIMDEFQRFPELIRSDDDNEATLLAKRFFNPKKRDEKDIKILLLSATPYKLYSTPEEIQDNKKDEHYEEFMDIMEFLFEHQPHEKNRFKTAWKNYSVTLNEIQHKDLAIILGQKNQAEEKLYNGICRTERMKVPGAADLVDEKFQKETLSVHEDDILSYVEMDKAIRDAGLSGMMPVEYTKSTPLIMSFMQKYKLKHDLQEKMKAFPDKLPIFKSPRLWVNRNKVKNYKPLDINHFKLNKLRKFALPEKASRMLWVPPSKSYYELCGPFQGQEGFSKTLVFSAWEMVPRAIAALLSYEAECLTVGRLVKNTPNPNREKRSYFNTDKKKRFPAPRVNFSMKDNEPLNMNSLCLLHPSVTLASMYDPVSAMNRKQSIREIRREIMGNIDNWLEKFDSFVRKKDQRQDERWYYMAPLLMGKSQPLIQSWFKNPVITTVAEDQDGTDSQDDDKSALNQHLKRLQELYQNPDLIELGIMPKDLSEILANMAIASPASCALRTLGICNYESEDNAAEAIGLSFQLAKTVVDRFNTQEAISMVDLSYGKAGKGVHWKNILRYCVDGNLQAVFDEYAHMLLDGYDLGRLSVLDRNRYLIRDMISSLKTHTASYKVDTYQAFCHRVKHRDDSRQKDKQISMRSSYAVGFYDSNSEGKSFQRKKNIRLSFNSPFRPFILATTSIGQEGLDFHYYCRNIVHWNLPGNPVDLEQREGRINRYKCHAIRLNVAHKYGSIMFENDPWLEMFSQAYDQERSGQTSDLVPFWSLTSNLDQRHIYNIQRFVFLYPMSKDGLRYERLMKILSLYRLSLGQARQEELLEYLFENEINQRELNDLFMNLSPYFRELCSDPNRKV